MQYVIGFVIALFIALTGVGAGTVTVPILGKLCTTGGFPAGRKMRTG